MAFSPLTIPAEITTLGGAIRWARRARGWDTRALARFVGCSPKFIQNLEYGCNGTSMVTRFEEELGVKLAHLPARRNPIRRTQREGRVASENAYLERKSRREREDRTGEGPLQHSLKDKLRALGLEGERTRIYGTCNFCHDMSWRRHKNGCVGCELPFAPEEVSRTPHGAVSNASYMAGPGDAAA